MNGAAWVAVTVDAMMAQAPSSALMGGVVSLPGLLIRGVWAWGGCVRERRYSAAFGGLSVFEGMTS